MNNSEYEYQKLLKLIHKRINLTRKYLNLSLTFLMLTALATFILIFNVLIINTVDGEWLVLTGFVLFVSWVLYFRINEIHTDSIGTLMRTVNNKPEIIKNIRKELYNDKPL